MQGPGAQSIEHRATAWQAIDKRLQPHARDCAFTRNSAQLQRPRIELCNKRQIEWPRCQHQSRPGQPHDCQFGMAFGHPGVIIAIIDQPRHKAAQPQVGISEVERGQRHPRYGQMQYGRAAAQPTTGDERAAAETYLAWCQSPAARIAIEHSAARHRDGVVTIISRQISGDAIGGKRGGRLQRQPRATPPGERGGDRPRPVDLRPVNQQPADEQFADRHALRL